MIQGQFEAQMGTLYLLLSTLVETVVIAATLRTSPRGRARPYCHVTEQGRDKLAHERRAWRTLIELAGFTICE